MSAKSRKAQPGQGGDQYILKLVKMMVEMIAVGATPSTIMKLMLIFAQALAPKADTRDLPKQGT